MKPIKREVIKPEIFKRISTDDLRIDTLITIKGLSVDKANALIKQYGSIMEIGEQTEKELQDIATSLGISITYIKQDKIKKKLKLTLYNEIKNYT